MNRWLVGAPRWVLAVFSGVLFGTFMGLFEGLHEGSWTTGLVAGVAGGLVYGPLVAVFQHRQFARYREAAGDVPQKDLRRALRGARKGRPPQDPGVRAAAVRVLTLQEEQLRKQRPWALPFFALMLVLFGYLAITQAWGWWLVGCVFLAFFAVQLLLPRRLERQAERLRES